MLGHILRPPRSGLQSASSGALQSAQRHLLTSAKQRLSHRSISSATIWRQATPTFRPVRLSGVRASTRGWTAASRRGFRFSAWRRNAADSDQSQNLSLSQRLKKLFKDYGKSAIGVYLALSVLDFPLCFLLVRVIGVETIGNWEHQLVSTLSQLVPDWIKNEWHKFRQSAKKTESDTVSNGEVSETMEMMTWGVGKAQKRHDEEASLGTQLALAYAIHKSFIFLRVPLTAAITPKIVKVLRSWGWKIGKRPS